MMGTRYGFILEQAISDPPYNQGLPVCFGVQISNRRSSQTKNHTKCNSNKTAVSKSPKPATGESRQRTTMQPAKTVTGEHATSPSMAAMTSIGWIQVSTSELIEEIRSYERKKSTAYIGVSGFTQFH
ncbi:hypothetical protein ASPVEDRAFT_409660 [Aspergillus versicolor CBS 583.65]|uniref:Uncharacterized protein n=1 Tax=Aspergillus versicolor CBS 583.65 TaxID=1036611 RepID=A0A1L9Q4L9_ASPVE|nr:uncharacterized protein ASPVEDRAFT_409660 [Aspergillus versicolor CBS 583.65]OJJ08686.1 hypothetical protein ASPVEDRAFT_409660 [Aspergillus versicolor CBS 583.65]